jgi:hypothetical protein
MASKVSVTIAVALSILGASTAFADCAATVKSNDAMMMKLTDAAKKDAVAKEEKIAKDMLDKKDEAGCKVHADKATEMMK